MRVIHSYLTAKRSRGAGTSTGFNDRHFVPVDIRGTENKGDGGSFAQ